MGHAQLHPGNLGETTIDRLPGKGGWFPRSGGNLHHRPTRRHEWVRPSSAYGLEVLQTGSTRLPSTVEGALFLNLGHHCRHRVPGGLPFLTWTRKEPGRFPLRPSGLLPFLPLSPPPKLFDRTPAKVGKGGWTAPPAVRPSGSRLFVSGSSLVVKAPRAGDMTLGL